MSLRDNNFQNLEYHPYEEVLTAYQCVKSQGPYRAEPACDEELQEKWGQLIDADVIHELFSGPFDRDFLPKTFRDLGVVVHVDEDGHPNTWGIGEPASADNVGDRKWLIPLVY